MDQENPSIILGDCLDVMKTLADKSVDMILCDLPYGTTKNPWDSVIGLSELWLLYNRIITDNGAIVLTAQTPFDKVLGASNLSMLKYEWIWQKNRVTGHLNANYAPLKSHENILVFSKSAACYVKDRSHAMKYNPQKSPVDRIIRKASATKAASTNYDTKWNKSTDYDNLGLKHPTSILQFDSERGLHPTQKPVPLFEFLIRTYTNEGDLVLDNCAGSCTTAVAAINTKRKYICIEKNPEYYAIGLERVNARLRE